MRAKGLNPGSVGEFQDPGSGGGAFVGKEFTPGNGTEGLLAQSDQRRQKFILHSQENILQFRRPGQEESRDEPHSNCPTGRRSELARRLVPANSLEALC